MTKRIIPTTPKIRPRVLGRQAFAAISAVEGLTLTREGRQRVEASAPLERRRADVIRAYVESKARKK